MIDVFPKNNEEVLIFFNDGTTAISWYCSGLKQWIRGNTGFAYKEEVIKWQHIVYTINYLNPCCGQEPTIKYGESSFGETYTISCKSCQKESRTSLFLEDAVGDWNNEVCRSSSVGRAGTL